MSRIPFGGACEIPFVEEKTMGDVFENAIRRVGVVGACEWFGYRPGDPFIQETIDCLRERSRAETA